MPKPSPLPALERFNETLAQLRETEAELDRLAALKTRLESEFNSAAGTVGLEDEKAIGKLNTLRTQLALVPARQVKLEEHKAVLEEAARHAARLLHAEIREQAHTKREALSARLAGLLAPFFEAPEQAAEFVARNLGFTKPGKALRLAEFGVNVGPADAIAGLEAAIAGAIGNLESVTA